MVPGNDPITMLALAVALCLLYEIAVQVARFHDRRAAKRLAGAGGLGQLDDDTASALPAATRDVGDAATGRRRRAHPGCRSPHRGRAGRPSRLAGCRRRRPRRARSTTSATRPDAGRRPRHRRPAAARRL